MTRIIDITWLSSNAWIRPVFRRWQAIINSVGFSTRSGLWLSPSFDGCVDDITSDVMVTSRDEIFSVVN
jgi:hypothetical protein